MSAISKTVTVEEAGEVKFRDPELRVGQVVRITVETQPESPSPEELAQRLKLLMDRIQSRPEIAEVTDEDIQAAIDEVRRASRP